MKEKAPKSLLVLCIMLCGMQMHAQCDFSIPLQQQFPCLFDGNTYDFSTLVSPPGGTFSGPGISDDGIFTPLAAIQGAGSSSTTETLTFTYEVDVAGSPCSASATVQLGIPIVSTIEPIPRIYCLDDPQVPLVGSPGMGTPNAAFTIDGVPPFGNDEFFPSFYMEGEHEIIFNFLDFSIGCFSRDTVVVEVFNESELNDMTQISQDPIPNTLCLDSSPVMLNPFPVDGVLSGDGIVGNTFDPAVAGLGSHTIFFEFTTPLGACSTIDSTTIEVGELVAGFAIDASACAGEVDTIFYAGTPQDGSLNISWDIMGASIESNIGDTILHVLAEDIGTYDVTLNVDGALACLAASSSDQVDKVGLVTVETIEDQIIGLDQDDLLLVTSAESNDGSAITFAWSPVDNLSCSDCQEPTLTPVGDETYTVVGTDANGCTASDELNISLSFTKDVFVPNAFTPNGDGRNDQFFVFGQGIVDMTLQIHDRWGSLVFETNDTSIGWDGTHAGEQLNSAVFYYYLNTTFVDGDVRQKTGDITLIR